MHVVISGANRGLGLALATVFAGRGDLVTAGCRTPASATDLQAVVGEVHPLDMESESSIGAFAAAAAARGPVDLLINNAGLDATSFGVPDGERDVLTLSAEHVKREINVNAIGPMLLTRGLLASLRASAAGRVVNVSSQIGSMEVSATTGRDVGYAVSKAALNMVTVKFAARLRAEGIAVIALHPGWLKTDMGGPSAMLDATETAVRIADLASSVTLADSGKFLVWDGTEHPW